MIEEEEYLDVEAEDTPSEEVAPGLLAERTLSKVIGSSHKKIERFRLILMFCACVNMLGFPTRFGSLVEFACGFAAPAFFFLSGFLVLSDSEKRRKRIARTLLRTAITFLVLVVLYTAINLYIYGKLGANVLPALKNGKLWLNFALFNVWPFDVGGAIWFVQSVLYSYIIIFVLDRIKLLRFDYIIFSVLLIFSVLTGELSGTIGFSLFGYSSLPSFFLNQGLPFILIGGFVGRNISKLEYVNPLFYVGALAIGLGLTFGEPILFSKLGLKGNFNHSIGMGLAGVALCTLVLQNVILRDMDDYDIAQESEFPITRFETNLIYYLYQPAGALFGFLIVALEEDLFSHTSEYLGVATFVALLIIAMVVGAIHKKIAKALEAKKAKKSVKKEADEEELTLSAETEE